MTFNPQRKPRPRRLDKRAIRAAKDRQWREVRQVVLKRDRGLCRPCGKRASEVHHVIFRSLGGKDEARNAIAVCLGCHGDIHGHVLLLRWTDGANPQRTVRFEWIE